ncbi:hypothetical protein HDG37_003592 [Paraburkholderia sp. MM5384-R2]|nr:hypothetical protein [Paraburkholderia sp. MM5384-R2]
MSERIVVHANTPIVVEVLLDDDYYARWVSAQKAQFASAGVDPDKVCTMAELVAPGEELNKANCAACHQVNGKDLGALQGVDGSATVNGTIAAHLQRACCTATARCHRGRHCRTPTAHRSSRTSAIRGATTRTICCSQEPGGSS